jgi:predicted TIM-barrel fold metal-dependent hydrolase
MSAQRPALFDAHLHIIDRRFPLASNDGYVPEQFTVADYRARTSHLAVAGGAVVSGSFQAFDQTYLLDALTQLGDGFVGVTQLPATVTDAQVMSLNAAGVRAVRFNARRGGSESMKNLEILGRRVYELAGWHTELYIDARDLPELAPVLRRLPKVSIDHLGLSKDGFAYLLALVERGAYVKATGFARGDLDPPSALRQLVDVRPSALMAGTDLPSTRAPRPFADTDLDVILTSVGVEHGAAVMHDNAAALYRAAGGR